MQAPPTPTFRDLRGMDFEDLVGTYWSMYDERARGETAGIMLFAERPSLAEEVEWFSRLYSASLKGELIAVVADVDGKAVGLCEIRCPAARGSSSEAGHVGELGILINRAHRGMGLGTELLLRALERARSRFEIVLLRVFATNSRAKRLYERLGFETVGRLPAAIHRGSEYIDEELMAVDLRRWTPPTRAKRG